MDILRDEGVINMEQLVEKQFSEVLIHKAGKGFGADTSNYVKLGDFESYIFEVKYKGKPTILRLTHNSHRTREQIEAEMEWVNYLYEHGALVSKPYLSNEGGYVVSLKVEDNFFYASLFEKAEGQKVDLHHEHFNHQLFEEWGRSTGELHRLTKSYQPIGVKRPNWDEEELLYPEKYISLSEKEVHHCAGHLVNELRNLPIQNDSFGLIHSDIHSGNFFIHEGKIQIFDFDDAQYLWFVHDIAIPIYYSAWYKFPNGTLQERSQFAKRFFESFLKGYEKQNHLDSMWLDKIPLFLNVRDLVLYNVFHKKMDIPSANERLVTLLKQIRKRIVTGESIIKLT
jgi:Ser/Thr protein kinase RdoA (MazF antagonist)